MVKYINRNINVLATPVGFKRTLLVGEIFLASRMGLVRVEGGALYSSDVLTG